MRYRLLGRTGLKVSEICLGTWTFGSHPSAISFSGSDEAESLAILDRFLDQGGNFIDTADGYAGGRSEEILGKGLKGRRDSLVLATKVYFPTGGGPNGKGLSRKHILHAVEASLRRLQTDYIDLYQPHCYDSRTPLDETLSALDTLVRQGKVRYLGCSNFTAWQLAKALGISALYGLARLDCLQPHYNLVVRYADRELMPLCREENVGVIAWSPLAGGFLSGKYRPGDRPPTASRLAQAHPAGRSMIDRYFTTRGYGILAELEAVARALGKPVPAVALAWTLGVPGMTAVIIGARTVHQLDENLAAAAWDLPAAQWSRLDQASALPLEYPQEFQAEVDAMIHSDVAPPERAQSKASQP